MNSIGKNIFFNLIILFLAIFSNAYSQVGDDLKLILKYNAFAASDLKQEEKETILIPSNLNELAISGLSLYQYFISSQDAPSCIYTPSCSKFAKLSIYHFGLIKGVLLTSDRLQRCHSPSARINLYSFNFTFQRFNDPVERYGKSK